jgi:hypothetical protein
MDRRSLFTAISAAAALAAAAPSAKAAETDSLMDVLQSSMQLKKGVTIYVNGAQINCVVTRAGQDYVEGRSMERSRIVIRTDKIDAVAMA